MLFGLLYYCGNWSTVLYKRNNDWGLVLMDFGQKISSLSESPLKKSMQGTDSLHCLVKVFIHDKSACKNGQKYLLQCVKTWLKQEKS